MSHRRVNKTLVNLGLTQTEAEVYTLLANKGPQASDKIAEALKLQDPLLYRSLENLRTKGVVNSTHERSALFYAMPFEKVLEMLLKEHLSGVEDIELNKNQILATWQAMIKSSKG